MTDTETQLREVFKRQAALLDPPVVSLEVLAAHPQPLRPLHRPTGWGARAAAATLAAVAVIGCVVLVKNSSSEARSTEAPGEGDASKPDEVVRPLQYDTPRVHAEATDLTVTISDRTFQPPEQVVQALGGGPGEVGVHSNGPTTLELVWHEDDGIEMRVNLYFESDGTDWWISKVWTYDGARDGDWLRSEGPFLRTSRGTPFEGDLHVGALDVKELYLQPLLD